MRRPCNVVAESYGCFVADENAASVFHFLENLFAVCGEDKKMFRSKQVCQFYCLGQRFNYGDDAPRF